MKASALNAFDGIFEIADHEVPMLAMPHLQGRRTLNDLTLRETNKIYMDLKHGAAARSFISSL